MFVASKHHYEHRKKMSTPIYDITEKSTSEEKLFYLICIFVILLRRGVLVKFIYQFHLGLSGETHIINKCLTNILSILSK